EEWAAAEAFAGTGLWEEAAALAVRSLARFPGRSAPDWFSAALLLRLAGDDMGYRRHRDRMAQQVAASSSPDGLANVLRTLLLDTASGELPKLRQRVVDRYEASLPRNPWRAGYLVDAYRRLGQTDRALLVAARLDLSAVAARPFLPTVAVAHFRGGKKDKARSLLREADAAYEQAFRTILMAGGPDPAGARAPALGVCVPARPR